MLSVIIPAYNEEKYLEKTLDNLYYHAPPSLNVVVVSDGSTDKTEKVALQYPVDFVQLRRRRGPAAAKNTGARVAKGDIFVFLDADTLVSDSVLKKIEKECIDHIGGSCHIIPDSLRWKHRFFYSLKNPLCKIFGISNGIFFCTRKTFYDHSGFPDGVGEDGYLLRRIKRKGKFLFLDETVTSSVRRFEKEGYLSSLWYWSKVRMKKPSALYGAVR